MPGLKSLTATKKPDQTSGPCRRYSIYVCKHLVNSFMLILLCEINDDDDDDDDDVVRAAAIMQRNC